MKRLLILVGTTAGSAIGWWIGSQFGETMTAFMVSMVGFGFGMWYGARVANRIEGR